MLNLFDPIHYTADEQTHVDTVLKPLLERGWKDKKNKTKKLKNRISLHTQIAQGGRCAYCESVLRKGASAIDHIAPKGLYGEFCYEPFNLVTACSSCNSVSIKGERDTIQRPVNYRRYLDNHFLIVHPYFDNPDEHIKYTDTTKTVFDKKRCSQKGLNTISFFQWEGPSAIRTRSEIYNTRNISFDVLSLIYDISTYK